VRSDTWLRWLKNLFVCPATRPVAPRRRRLFLELLEDRVTPTTYTPNTFADPDVSVTHHVNVANGHILLNSNNSDTGVVSLRSAVFASNATGKNSSRTAGSLNTISLQAGIYQLTIGNTTAGHPPDDATTGHLDILGAVTIQGATLSNGAPSTVIAAVFPGIDTDKLFSVDATAIGGFDTTFSQVEITGGFNNNSRFDAAGGGLDFLGAGNTCSLTMTDCLVDHNTVTSGIGSDGGGGLEAEQGNVTLTRCQFLDNTTINTSGGGIAFVADHTLASTFTLNQCTISGNVVGGAGNDGGGIRVRVGGTGTDMSTASSLLVHGCTITDNIAFADGGGVAVLNDDPMTVTLDQGTVLDGNTCGGFGAGLFNAQANNGAKNGTTTLTGVTVTNNIAVLGGGGLWNNAEQLTVSDSRIAGNLTTSGVSAAGQNSNNTATPPVTTATNNWWGTNTNPTVAVDSRGDTLVDDGVNAATWLVLGVSASPTAVLVNGGTATVTADLTHNNAGTPGFSVPDTTPDTFGTTALGSVLNFQLLPSANISAISESGNIVTVVTSTASGFTPGQVIDIRNVPVSGYNGTFTVASVVNGATFAYKATQTGLSASSGGSAKAHAHLQSGPAGVEFMAGSVAGSGNVPVTVDGQTVSAAITVTAPALTISSSHSGRFDTGDTSGDTYTLTVTNAGDAATVGTVTVNDTLPTGLTLTTAAGTVVNGWTVNPGTGNTVVATRSDALPAGASYGALTFGVAVAANAATSVTNFASVTGGDSVNTFNNTTSDPTTITQVPDLTVSATHAGPFDQGDAGVDTISITVSNAGGAASTGTVAVVDTLPAGLTLATPVGLQSSGWTLSVGSGNSVTAIRSDALAAGTSYPTLTLAVTVAANAAASLTNNVRVVGGGEANTSNDSAQDVIAVTQVPDLVVSLLHGGPFKEGDTFGDNTTIKVLNIGNGATSGLVTVSGTLPVGLTLATSLTSDNGWTLTPIGSNSFLATRSDALAAGSSYPDLTIGVAVAVNAAPLVVNSVNVSGGGEVKTSNDTATDTITISQLPDLTVSATHAGTFVQGDTSGDTVSVTVTNSGGAATSGTVTVTDTLPAGLTLATPVGLLSSGWTLAAGAGNTVTATHSNGLAAGASYTTLTFNVMVAANAAASLTNNVSVAGGGEVVTSDSTAQDVIAVTQVPDLAVSSSHSGPFEEGDTTGDTYTITVSNVGDGATSGTVTVTDTLPTGVTLTTAAGTVVNGWTVNPGTGNTVVAMRSDALAAGKSYGALTFGVAVSATAGSGLNSVSVAGGGELNESNDFAIDFTTINEVADLTVSATHAGNFVQGDTGGDTVSITVANAGGASTGGLAVTVTDTLPTGLTLATPVGALSSGWILSTGPGNTVTATRSDALTAGASYPVLTFDVTVAPDAAASLTNNVAVAGGAEVNTSNDTAQDTIAVQRLANLTISSSHSGPFRQGDTTGDTYTLTVSNAGGAATSGLVTVSETLPAGLTPTAFTGTGWTTSINGQTVSATRSDALAGGASYPSLTLSVSVAHDAAAGLTPTANVSGGGEVITSDDSAGDPTTIAQAPDLSVVLAHIGSFRQGDAADTYEVVVGNAGFAPTDGTPVTATVVLPAGLTPTSFTGTGWTTSVSGQTVTATRSDALPAGLGYELILTVSVADDAAALLTPTLTAAGGGDIVAGNDTFSDQTIITQVADLTVGSTHTDPFRQGDSGVTYTLHVSNVGRGTTVGLVTVTDTLPAGLTLATPPGTVVNGWTVNPAAGNTVVATRSDALAAGSSYTDLTFAVTVSLDAAPSLTNDVSVAGGGEVITSNDTATDPTTITQLPDLTVSGTHAGAFAEGDAGGDTASITVTNAGFAATSGLVTVTDTFPAGLTLATPVGLLASGWALATGPGNTVIATRTDALAAGSSYPVLTFDVTVASDAAAALTNNVTVAGGGEVDTANDTAQDLIAVIQVADLTIASAHSGPFVQGDTTGDTYTLTVSNVGPADTTGLVTVSETLPTGLTPTAFTGNGWVTSVNGQTVTATRSDALPAGSSYDSLTLAVSVAHDAPASLTPAAVVSGGGEVVTSNDSAGDRTTITPAPDLAVMMSHSGDFRQRDAADTYTVTVSNVGFAPTDGTTVTVTVTLPTGLTPTGFAGQGWVTSLNGQTATATRSDALPAGSAYDPLTLTVSVADDAAGLLTSAATVAGGGDIVPENDHSSDPTRVTRAVAPNVGPANTAPFRQGTSVVTATVPATNVGPGSTVGTGNVADTLPGTVLNGGAVIPGAGNTVSTSSGTLAADEGFDPFAFAVYGPTRLTNLVSLVGAGDEGSDTATDVNTDETDDTTEPDRPVPVSPDGDFLWGADTFSQFVSTMTRNEPMLQGLLQAGFTSRHECESPPTL
jgi:uncharacterized repeat protein (TIGR01451 family)